MNKKISLALIVLLLALALVACGDNTATPAPAATTAAATTAAGGGAAATTAPAAATTAAATTAAATTAAINTTLAAQADTVTGVAPLPPLPAIPADAKKGGTLTVANAGPLASNIPPVPTNGDVVGAWYHMYDLLWAPGLLQYNYNSLQWQLEMAKDFKVDPTGKIFTMTLRPDLKWSDGSPITVDDFQYTFDNAAKPNKENPAANYARLADLLRVASYKTDAATSTITITMAATYARDIALYFANFAPVPKKVWEGKPFFDPANNPEYKKPTVTSGPYKIESYDANTQAVLVANPNWYRGKPNWDKIIFKPIAPNLIYDAIKTGQADVTLDQMPAAQFNEIKANTEVKTYEWNGVQPNFRYIVYNTTKAPFNDQKLRQGIAYALDRATVIKLAESGRAQPQYTYIPEANPFFNPDVSRYNFSLDTAKKTLDEAGYKQDGAARLGKDGQPLKFSMSYATTDLEGKVLATYVQAQLKQLGIDVSVDSKDPQSYLTDLVTKKYDVGTGVTGATVFPDPDTAKFFYIKDGVFNVAGFVLPRIDEIFTQGASELDNAKRKALYTEVQKILSDQLPSEVLYGQTPYIVAGKKLGGIVPSKGGRIDLNSAVATWYFTS